MDAAGNTLGTYKQVDWEGGCNIDGRVGREGRRLRWRVKVEERGVKRFVLFFIGVMCLLPKACTVNFLRTSDLFDEKWK